MIKLSKSLWLIIFSFLMSMSVYSQIIPHNETRVLTNKNGDIMIIMHLSDAKTILADLLDKSVVDSIIHYYQVKDTESLKLISINKSQIEILQQKSLNKDKQIENLELIINNKDSEIVIKDYIIKNEKKKTRKQIFLKKLAITVAVVLPITVLLLK